MKAYIRNKSSRLFYAGWGQWRHDYRQALSFENLTPAFTRVALDQLEASEIILIEQGGVEITFTAGPKTASLPIAS